MITKDRKIVIVSSWLICIAALSFRYAYDYCIYDIRPIDNILDTFYDINTLKGEIQ